MELDAMLLKKTPPQSVEAEKTALGGDSSEQQKLECGSFHYFSRGFL